MAIITIEEEFKRNPEVSKEGLEALKFWYLTQPHLPKISGMFHYYCNVCTLAECPQILGMNYTMRS